MPPPNPDKNVKAFSIKIGELIIFLFGNPQKVTKYMDLFDFKQMEWLDKIGCI